jgi:hypothetical protein
MLRQQSKTVSQQLKQLSERNDLSPATHSGFHDPSLSSQFQLESCMQGEADDAGSKASTRRDISAESALAVLTDLAEIRDMKAGSLERSIERESVSQAAAVVRRRLLFGLFFFCRCSSAISPTLKPNSHPYQYAVFRVPFYIFLFLCF